MAQGFRGGFGHTLGAPSLMQDKLVPKPRSTALPSLLEYGYMRAKGQQMKACDVDGRNFRRSKGIA